MAKAASFVFLFACSIGNVLGVDFELRPRVDSFIEGRSLLDYSNSSDLVVKEIYQDQKSQRLIRRSFLEFDLTEFAGHVVDVATLHLWLKNSEHGAVIMLCPADPFVIPISWKRQPVYDCEKALGEVRYLPGMSDVNWDILPYIQQQLRLNNKVIAFALIAAAPHFYTTFRSMEYKDENQRPLLRVEGFEPPFNHHKFKNVLSESRLQWPLPTPTAVSNGKFGGYASHHFQVIDGKYLQFEVRGEHHRCLLRHNTFFSTATSKEKIVKTRMYLPEPAYPTREVSLIQTDSESTGGHQLGSLIRIGWHNAKDNLRDHIWAKLRTSVEGNETVSFPLFPRPEGFFHMEIIVTKGKLSIKYNGNAVPLSPELESYDVSFWEPVHHNVFQVGILLNHGHGPASVLYDSIEISAGSLEQNKS